MLPFLPSFINPLLLFPVSPDLSTLLPLKPMASTNGRAALSYPLLFGSPRTLLFPVVLISLETPLESIGVAQDSPAPCV